MKNKVLRLLFRFSSEYKGSPLFISGNSLRHAISRQINVSFGSFIEKGYLISPETYDDFFGIRTEKPFLTPHTQLFFSKCEKKKKNLIFFMPSGVTFDVINPSEDLITYIKNLEIIQLGGLRNEGFGIVELIDHVFIDLNDIELPSDGTHITLLSPILYVPKFLESYQCRQENIIFWNNGKKNRLKAISAGQFFRIKKNRTIKKIALIGILRKVLFGQFGFGEFQINNWQKEEN